MDGWANKRSENRPRALSLSELKAEEKIYFDNLSVNNCDMFTNESYIDT